MGGVHESCRSADGCSVATPEPTSSVVLVCCCAVRRALEASASGGVRMADSDALYQMVRFSRNLALGWRTRLSGRRC